MEYRDFVEQVKEQIQDFLPEKFADAAVEVNQIVKNNDCVLDGLMVRTEESNIAPTIYLNPYFEQIQDGAELDDVLAQIASVYQSPPVWTRHLRFGRKQRNRSRHSLSSVTYRHRKEMVHSMFMRTFGAN